MLWRLVVLAGLVVGVAASPASMLVAAQDGPAHVTFNKDVLPFSRRTVRAAIGPVRSRRCPSSPTRTRARGRAR
jgi:hypothetical protein